MREQAKVKINDLVRFHQPQEDVDTIRGMINKYGDSGGQLYHDNCFHVQNSTPYMSTDYNDNPVEKFDDVHIQFKADKEFLTSEEVDEFEAAVIAGREARAAADFDGEFDQQDLDVGYNQFYLDQGTRMTTTMRTSQLIYPENGRMPAMTERGRETAAYFRALQSRSPEGPEDRNLYDRCIIGFNAGPPMRSGAYNNIMKLVQTEDHVAIMVEMVNDHRIIPTGNSSADLPDDMRLWKGDSRGSWDGDTFVVTTKNFTHLSRFSGTGESMVLTEKFTRLDDQRLEYEWTVEDLEMFEDKFTAVVEMQLTLH